MRRYTFAVVAVLLFLLPGHRSVRADAARYTIENLGDKDGLLPTITGINAAGQVVLSSRQTAMKVKNLRREPYASVCVFTDGFYGPWCQIEGPAHVVDLPEAMEPLVDYYRRAAGKEHPDWDEYREAMVREQRVLVVIDVERTGPSVSG